MHLLMSICPSKTTPDAFTPGRVVADDDITMASEALGIAEITAKTHLARLFSKTRTNRQSVLAALAKRVVTATIAKA